MHIQTGYKLAIFVLLSLLTWVIVMRLRRSAGVWKLRHFAYPKGWMGPLHDQVPLYNKLPWELRAPLQDLMVGFLDSKKWRSFGGLEEVTNEMKVPIAAHASFLLLNRPNPGMYLGALTLHMFPSSHFQPGQPHTEEHPSSTALMIWDEKARHSHDLVDHDRQEILQRVSAQLTGSDPAIRTLALSHSTWARLLSPEYATATPVLPASAQDYPGDDFPEFFAIATEAFLHCPAVLVKKHPDLYLSLRSFYKLDPVRWTLD